MINLEFFKEDKMKFLICIPCAMMLLFGSCPSEDDKPLVEEKEEITLGDIIFEPYTTINKVDLITSSKIIAKCSISNKDYQGIKYYYTLDGSEPTESSDYYQDIVLSDSPIEFNENDWKKHIKILAVYDNNNGKKITKTGEAQYNIKYFRLDKKGSVSNPIKISKGNGYYGFAHFSDMFGRDIFNSYYKASENGTMKIHVSSSNTLVVTIAVYKNNNIISTKNYSYNDSISVTTEDIIRINGTQGSMYQIGGKAPFDYEISLE